MEKIEMKRIFIARLHHSMKFSSHFNWFSRESRWLFFPFSTIDSTTVKPKLKLVNKVTLNFNQKVFGCWSRKSIAWWMIACHLYLAMMKSKPLWQNWCVYNVLQCTIDIHDRLTTHHGLSRVSTIRFATLRANVSCGRQSNCLPALFTFWSRS